VRTYLGIPPAGIPKNFKVFKDKMQELEYNQLGLSIIDPRTTIAEFYDPPFPESVIKELFEKYRRRN